MPELPEVESVRQALLPYVNHIITDVVIHDAWLRQPIPGDMPSQLKNCRLINLIRVSKYVIWQLENAPDFIVHLGMSGRIEGRDLAMKHDKISWHFEDLPSLYFNDARRFGFVVWRSSYSMPILGPEPLTPSFTPDYLAKIFAKRTTAIKIALLDQSLIAGLGNIYACEALYDAAISPLRPANSLTEKDLAQLHLSINKIIARAIELAGSSWRDYRKPDGQDGSFQNEFKVYDREGQATEYGQVLRIKQAGRSTYYCPGRQQ